MVWSCTRREENSIVRRAMELEVEGRRPVGRPKKTWSKVVKEDIRKLNITEDTWQRIDINGGNSSRSTIGVGN